MTDPNGMAPGLSEEQQARVLASMERMKRRQREGNYRTNPPVPAKLQSMAPGMHVVQPASGPPVPFPTPPQDEEPLDQSHTKEEDPEDR